MNLKLMEGIPHNCPKILNWHLHSMLKLARHISFLSQRVHGRSHLTWLSLVSLDKMYSFDRSATSIRTDRYCSLDALIPCISHPEKSSIFFGLGVHSLRICCRGRVSRQLRIPTAAVAYDQVSCLLPWPALGNFVSAFNPLTYGEHLIFIRFQVGKPTTYYPLPID